MPNQSSSSEAATYTSPKRCTDTGIDSSAVNTGVRAARSRDQPASVQYSSSRPN